MRQTSLSPRFSILLLLFLFPLALSAGDTCRIRGHLAGVDDGYVITVYRSAGRTLDDEGTAGLDFSRACAELVASIRASGRHKATSVSGWRPSVPRWMTDSVSLNDLKGETGLAARYGVNGIPHYVVISPAGQIVKVQTGYGEGLFSRLWDEVMREEK